MDVHLIRALLFGVYTRAPDFWHMPETGGPADTQLIGGQRLHRHTDRTKTPIPGRPLVLGLRTRR